MIDNLCEKCGHKRGSHSKVKSSNKTRFYDCKIKGCKCKKFKPKDDVCKDCMVLHSPQNCPNKDDESLSSGIFPIWTFVSKDVRVVRATDIKKHLKAFEKEFKEKVGNLSEDILGEHTTKILNKQLKKHFGGKLI